MFFSDLHVQLLSRGILNPGEQLTGQTVTSYAPWWAFGLIRKQYLVLATDQRLALIEHRFDLLRAMLRLHGVDSLPWAQVEEVKVTGLFKKKLKIRGTGERGPVRLKMTIPNWLFGLLAPMKKNVLGAKQVAAAHQGRSQAPALPTSYPPPALLGVPSSIPAVNAPGYASAPPPAPFGVAQPPASVNPAQPAAYGAPPPSFNPNGYPPRQY